MKEVPKMPYQGDAFLTVSPFDGAVKERHGREVAEAECAVEMWWTACKISPTSQSSEKGVHVSFRQRNRMILDRLGEAFSGEIVPYPNSLAYRENGYFVLGRRGGEKVLLVLVAGRRAERVTRLFDIEAGPEIPLGRKTLRVLVCRTSHKNAVGVRTVFANLRPRALGLVSTFGLGDRLGLATAGQATVARRYGVLPVLAQQSIREMSRTGRTPDDVMDDAMWGAFQIGYAGVFGADADHLKNADDITRCAEAGFTHFTVDPGAFVNNDADSLSGEDLRRAFEALDEADTFRSAFAGSVRDFPEASFAIRFDDETLARSAVKYAPAIDHVERMYRHVGEVYKGDAFDFEVSVDETDAPTSPHDHAFVALELARRGVAFTALAPRFVGDFEKAIDYRGDLGLFRQEFVKHAAIARSLGPYKISIHSGSDKFSIFPIVGDLAGGLLHEKTAGTWYVEAVRVIARHDPDLYRRLHTLALERFPEDRASYHLTTNVDVIPPAEELADDELETLLDERNVRQVIHVTYGSALTADDGRLRADMVSTLMAHEEEHYDVVGSHVARHIEAIGMGSAASVR